MKFLMKSVFICTILIIAVSNYKVFTAPNSNTGETLLELLHAVEDALDEVSASCEIPMPVTKFVAVCRQIEKIIRKIKFKRKVLPKIRYLCEKLDLMVSDIKKRINMGEIHTKETRQPYSVEETTKYKVGGYRKGTVRHVRSRLYRNFAHQPRAFGVFYTTQLYD